MRSARVLSALLALLLIAPAHLGAAPDGATGHIGGVVTLRGKAIAATIELRRVRGEGDLSGMSIVEPIVSGEPMRRMRSAADGRYAFEAVPAGLYQMRAMTEDGATAYGVARIVPEGRHMTRDLRILPGRQGLEGRVRWKDGRAYQGLVLVGQYDHGLHTLPRLSGGVAVRTDREGRFRVEGLLPGECGLVAIQPGVMRATLGTIRLPRSGEAVFTVDSETREVRGRVLSEPGARPLAGASVLVRGVLPNRGSYATIGRTGEDGTIVLVTGLEDPDAIVEADGHRPGTGSVNRDGEFLVLLRRTARLHGTVRDEATGKPVAGATVFACHVERREYASASSNAAGRYEIQDAPAGRIEMYVRGAGFVSENYIQSVAKGDEYEFPFHQVAADAEAEIDVTCRKSGVVRLRLTDANGKPVAGAEISPFMPSIRGGRHGSLANEMWSVLASGHEGLCTADSLVSGQRYVFYIRGDGFSQREIESVAMERGTGETVAVLLHRERYMTGQIRLGGKALGDHVTVRVRPVDWPAGMLPGFSRPEGPWERASLNHTGRYRHKIKSEKSYEVRATAWIGDRLYRAVALRRPGALRADLALEPAREGNLQGARLVRVVDAQGRPVPRGRYRYHVPDDGSHKREREGWFEYGRFDFDTRSFTDSVYIDITDAQDLGGRPLPLGSVFSGPHEPGIVDITLGAEKIIQGQLRTQEGNPVPNAEVTAWRRPPGASEDKCDAVAHARTRSDAEGRFRLRGLGSREYEIEVELPRQAFVAPEAVRVTAGGDDVTIQVTALIRPRVTCVDEMGTPIRDLDVTMEWTRGISDDWDGPWSTGGCTLRTDAKGQVTFSLVDPKKRFPLRIEARRGAYLRIVVPLWSPKHETFTLQRARAVRGVVRGADGKGVADALVFLKVHAGTKLPRDWSFQRIEGGYLQGAITHEDGSFEIGNLPNADFELFAAIVGRTVLRTPKARARAGEAELELVFDSK